MEGKSYCSFLQPHHITNPEATFAPTAVGKVKYYNRIDEELELPLDILDPLLSESMTK